MHFPSFSLHDLECSICERKVVCTSETGLLSDEVSSVMASERDLMALTSEYETWDQNKLKESTVILSPWLILLWERWNTLHVYITHHMKLLWI